MRQLTSVSTDFLSFKKNAGCPFIFELIQDSKMNLLDNDIIIRKEWCCVLTEGSEPMGYKCKSCLVNHIENMFKKKIRRMYSFVSLKHDLHRSISAISIRHSEVDCTRSSVIDLKNNFMMSC